ncbi:MAG: transcriptional repressor LexA [Clostridia bacterium]|nr:transcriptional repressor LexA [Clostridia bacterium]
MKDYKAMSKKQKVVYESVKKFISNGTVPTVREICDDTGLSSTSTVHSHLRTLERKGYISRDKKHRSLKIVGAEPTTAVPILGRVTAGLPVYAFEDILGYAPVLASETADKELFALRVSGESMKDIGILDGDVVVCEKKNSARNGDIVVALIGEEATVKTFYKDKENGHFRLQPQNPDFEPIIADEIEILGKVISLYREF